MANTRNQTIKDLRAEIDGMQDHNLAEDVFEKIAAQSDLSDSDKQKLQINLQTKVNELKQAEHDAKFASGDKEGADRVINPPKEVQKDSKGNILPSTAPLSTPDNRGARGEKPITVPEGCEIREVSADELAKIQDADTKLHPAKRKLVGVRPVKPASKGMPATSFLAIVKVAMLMLFILTSAVQAFAAYSSDDEGMLGNQRWNIKSTGALVPGANQTYEIGASGNEVASLYAKDVIVSNYIRSAYYSKLTRPASGAPVGSVITMKGANVGDCGTTNTGANTTFVVCVSDGTNWLALNKLNG